MLRCIFSITVRLDVRIGWEGVCQTGQEMLPFAPHVSLWHGHPGCVNCSGYSRRAGVGTALTWHQRDHRQVRAGKAPEMWAEGASYQSLLQASPGGASIARRVSPRSAESKELSLVTQLAGPLQSLSFRDFHSVLLIRHLASAPLSW